MQVLNCRVRKDKPHIVKGFFTGEWMVSNFKHFTLEDRRYVTALRYVSALNAAARLNGEPCAHAWDYIGGGHKGAVYQCRYCGEKDGL